MNWNHSSEKEPRGEGRRYRGPWWGLPGATRVRRAHPVVPLRLGWGVGPLPVLGGSLSQVTGPEFCSFWIEWNRRPRPKAFSWLLWQGHQWAWNFGRGVFLEVHGGPGPVLGCTQYRCSPQSTYSFGVDTGRSWDRRRMVREVTSEHGFKTILLF